MQLIFSFCCCSSYVLLESQKQSRAPTVRAAAASCYAKFKLMASRQGRAIPSKHFLLALGGHAHLLIHHYAIVLCGGISLHASGAVLFCFPIGFSTTILLRASHSVTSTIPLRFIHSKEPENRIVPERVLLFRIPKRRLIAIPTCVGSNLLDKAY